ncbi:MAG: flagellar biosynthesis anti-sigma factor FlgM [Planctomycetia bacterium]|nr:flagellar biosynthesis anti-sigma factor FlgM [Planctomycetia bacterium]
MRETSPRGWHRRRLTAVHAKPGSAFGRITCLTVTSSTTNDLAPPICSEVPGPDGIRRELVARIRREIAEGTYDTEEKWLAAEEALFRRIEGRA